MFRIYKRQILFLVVMIGVLITDLTWINKANRTYAREYLNESIALSMTTYATCRIINGGVSSLQESSISISPLGIGLEYEAGQVLDPINDATERLSDACVKAMALLGVERLLLAAVNKYTVVPFYILLAALIVSMSIKKAEHVSLFLGRAAILLLLLRISVPIMSFAGTEINRNYFVRKVNQQKERLAKVKEIALAEFETEVPEMELEDTELDGVWTAVAQFVIDFKNKIIEYSSIIKQRAGSLTEAIGYLKNNFSDIAESLAALFVLVIEKIIVQVFVLPLLILYGLKKTFPWITGESFEKFMARARGPRQEATPATPDMN